MTPPLLWIILMAAFAIIAGVLLATQTKCKRCGERRVDCECS